MSAGKSRTPLWKTLKELFAEGGLPSVFVEGLGWSQGNLPVSQVSVDDDVFSLSPIAELKNYWIIEISGDDIPTPKEQSAIDRKVAELYPERILVFSDGNAHHWRWPRETPSGGVSFETFTVGASSLPSFLAQRLVGLAFGIAEFRAGITLVDVRNRVRGKFDAAKVTKKFFDAFKVQRTNLAESIVGLDSEEQQSSYSTLLLNRLMLLYFLQKREFLNGDPNYLENCLAEVKGLKGDQQFFGFYRDVLLPMFFERLASHRQTQLEPKIEKLLGDIPYINGGIYEPSELEKTHGDSLNVPDQAFERIFAFFGAFNWHLDTRPSGLENEINPEVIGYIFEQYINLTTGGKKDSGAYYTPEDVTGYMVGATLVPRVVDYLVELDIPIFDLVQADPLRYVYPDMLHGFNHEGDQWLEASEELVSCWKDDPINWHILDDAEQNPELCLPGETWVEMFYRRERIESLLPQLRNGLIIATNDLITHNLNSRLLLTDAIDRIDSAEVAMKLWRKVTSMSVLDPTCGSGAFLFAAMEALEDIYHHLLNVIESVPENSETASLTSEAAKHPNERYFVRKSIALNNLYGTDLMPDAVETAKLRIFLALVSCLETREELEPLPDLDFNLKCGNLLVGLKDADDVERVSTNFVDALFFEELTPEISEFSAHYMQFVELSAENDGASSLHLKANMKQLTENLRKKVNAAYVQMDQIDEASRDEWIEKYRPFHWFCEFPAVIELGGFDVITGNPPYIRDRNMSVEEKRQISRYRTGGSPDLFAVCYERSLSLLNSRGGRHAFIVALSLSFGKRFTIARELIANELSTTWWSTYAVWPTSLFSGVRIRSTVVVGSTTKSGPSRWATKHNVFSGEQRSSLFTSLQFHASSSEGGDPVARPGLCTGLLESIQKAGELTGARRLARVYLRPTAQYWLPALRRLPPVLSADGEILMERDPQVIPLSLFSEESEDVCFGILSGKLGYLAWSSLGDDFHVKEADSLPARKIRLLIDGTSEGEELARSVWIAGLNYSFVSKNNDGYINVRWSAVRRETDVFDRWLLEAAGLASYWRPLNIWYRQSMASTRDNLNSRYLSEMEAVSHLGLPPD